MIIGSKEFTLGERTYLLGILNVTPDSFSDGGRFVCVEEAVKRAKEMVDDGADIIDLGGESTKPGFVGVSDEEELNRVIPVLKELVKQINVPISIDTRKPLVAKEALKLGACMINDVSVNKQDDMYKVCAEFNAPYCIMHNRENENYKNFVKECVGDLKREVERALHLGVTKENIIVDPGLGFAKSYEQNFEILNNLEEICALGYPVLVGASRKRFLGRALNREVDQREYGNLAVTAISILKGCNFVRVHDVKKNKDACTIADMILKQKRITHEGKV